MSNGNPYVTCGSMYGVVDDPFTQAKFRCFHGGTKGSEVIVNYGDSQQLQIEADGDCIKIETQPGGLKDPSNLVGCYSVNSNDAITVHGSFGGPEGNSVSVTINGTQVSPYISNSECNQL